MLKNFIDSYRECPLCSNVLAITAIPQSSAASHLFSVTTSKDRLIINVRTDYFMGRSNKSFDFSISIINGQIISCDQANQFLSLYDLNIFLTKECMNCCRKFPGETFSRSVNIFYDLSASTFVSKPRIEFFSISENDVYYYFCNNFETKTSWLTVQPVKSSRRNPPLHTTYIPFGKFNFQNRKKLAQKLQAIQMLY